MRYAEAIDWFETSPQVCLGCGALVHWLHTESHDERHRNIEIGLEGEAMNTEAHSALLLEAGVDEASGFGGPNHWEIVELMGRIDALRENASRYDDLLGRIAECLCSLDNDLNVWDDLDERAKRMWRKSAKAVLKVMAR